MQKSHLATSNVTENESWLVPWQPVLNKLACALYTDIAFTQTACAVGACALKARAAIWLVCAQTASLHGRRLTVLLADGLCIDSSARKLLVHWQLLL
jgi:hypothetical protein